MKSSRYLATLTGVFCGMTVAAVFRSNHWSAWLGLAVAVILAMTTATILDRVLNRRNR